MSKRCDSCGKFNLGDYVDGDACNYCCNPLFNEYGKYHKTPNLNSTHKEELE